MTFGIGVVTRHRRYYLVPQLLLSRGVIGLVAIEANAGEKRAAVLFSGGTDVDYASGGIRVKHR